RNKNILRDIRSKDLPMGQALLESSYSAYRAGQLGYAEMALSRKTLTDLRLKDIELRSLILNARLKCLEACDTSAIEKDKLESGYTYAWAGSFQSASRAAGQLMLVVPI